MCPKDLYQSPSCLPSTLSTHPRNQQHNQICRLHNGSGADIQWWWVNIQEGDGEPDTGAPPTISCWTPKGKRRLWWTTGGDHQCRDCGEFKFLVVNITEDFSWTMHDSHIIGWAQHSGRLNYIETISWTFTSEQQRSSWRTASQHSTQYCIKGAECTAEGHQGSPLFFSASTHRQEIHMHKPQDSKSFSLPEKLRLESRGISVISLWSWLYNDNKTFWVLIVIRILHI